MLCRPIGSFVRLLVGGQFCAVYKTLGGAKLFGYCHQNAVKKPDGKKYGNIVESRKLTHKAAVGKGGAELYKGGYKLDATCAKCSEAEKQAEEEIINGFLK